MSVKFTIVDMTTGAIACRGCCSVGSVQRQNSAKKPNHIVVEGDWSDAEYFFDLDAGEFREKPPMVMPEHVNRECTKRIRTRFREHDQINAILAGGEKAAEISAWVGKNRTAAKTLKATSPIPLDFKDDKHWPERRAQFP